MAIYTPYTYIIGWTSQNKFYYGVRFAGGCHPSDLFVSYFTSSRVVNQFIQDFGKPDIIEVRKTFLTASAARAWESKVLRRLQAHRHPLMLNQTTNTAIALTEKALQKRKLTLMKKYGEGGPLKGVPKPDHVKRALAAGHKRMLEDPTLGPEWRQRSSTRATQRQSGTSRPKAFSDKMANKRWINDGTHHKRISSEAAVPEGWQLGRIKTWVAPSPIYNIVNTITGEMMVLSRKDFCSKYGYKTSNLPTIKPGQVRTYLMWELRNDCPR